MAKKKRSELLAVKVKCGCGETLTFEDQCGQSLQGLSWRGSESECEICGSHGGVYLSFTCSKCKTYNEIEVYAW
jgi:hypothetical protein